MNIVTLQLGLILATAACDSSLQITTTCDEDRSLPACTRYLTEPGYDGDTSEQVMLSQGQNHIIPDSTFTNSSRVLLDGVELKTFEAEGGEVGVRIPEGMRAGRLEFVMVQGRNSYEFSNVFGLSGDGIPVITAPATAICTDTSFYNEAGELSQGTKACSTPLPECSSDGQTACITNTSFPAVEGSSLAAKVVSGNTVAGIAGTTIAISNPGKKTPVGFTATQSYSPYTVSLAWTDQGAASGFLLVTNSSTAITFTPADGTTYSTGPQGSDEIIYLGSSNSHTHSGLTLGSNHHYALYAYNADKQYSSAVLTDLSKSCQGKFYAGYCWHLAALDTSCTTTCESFGGVSPGTIDYTGGSGDSGNFDNCQRIVELLDYFPGGSDNLTSIWTVHGYPWGCASEFGGGAGGVDRGYYNRDITTHEATTGWAYRTCSCIR